MNKPYVANLLVRNALGHPLSVPLESIRARWVGTEGQVPADTVRVSTVPDKIGHYAVTFTVCSWGTQRLSLQLAGEDVVGSPFVLTQLVR